MLWLCPCPFPKKSGGRVRAMIGGKREVGVGQELMIDRHFPQEPDSCSESMGTKPDQLASPTPGVAPSQGREPRHREYE